jgi:tetratricopeptide (TPR) repeat protein
VEEGVGLWHADEWGFVDSAGGELVGLKHQPDAIELFRHFLTRNPDRLAAYDRLAALHAGLKDRQAAREVYADALERAESGSDDRRWFEWKTAWIDGLTNPRNVSPELLAEYSGNYGSRQVRLIDGVLYYVREGSVREGPRAMYAIADDTFVLESLDSLKLRFDRAADGRVDRISGLYLNGQRDENLRDVGP